MLDNLECSSMRNSSEESECWRDLVAGKNREPDVFTYKGKTYTASKGCPPGLNMRWGWKKPLLGRRKVFELGCMTDAEYASWGAQINANKAQRNAGLQQMVQSMQGLSNTIQNQQMEQRMRTNEYNTWQNKMKLDGY